MRKIRRVSEISNITRVLEEGKSKTKRKLNKF